jgi:glycyl-tRNA synthetase beta chain
VAAQVMQYFYDRLRGYVVDQGAKADEYESVLAVSPTQPLDFMQRLKAVAEFRKLEQAES